jgi:hypothetical protein
LAEAYAAGEHTRSACAASQLVQGSEKVACCVCISALIVSGTGRPFYPTTLHNHTVLQHLDLSGLHRRSVAEGDERSRYDGLQKRAHGVAMAFVTLLHPVPGGVGILSIVTALSTTITKDEDAKKRTPQKMD